VSVGHIYVIDTSLAKPQKEKITLCICAADNLFFWINTKAARHGDGQMPLGKDDHYYLTHDCFLDCSRVTTFPPSELANAKHIGEISKEFASRIVDFLKVNPPRVLSKRYIDLAISKLGEV
jgi:hypothetical protein